MRMAAGLAADVDYVERHTTNARMLAVCRGVSDAYKIIAGLEMRIEQLNEAHARALKAKGPEMLANLSPKVISQHCPTCEVRRGNIRAATKRWRKRKMAKGDGGAAASLPKN